MKKSIIIACLLLSVAASAQSTGGGKDWYLGLNVGPQVFNGVNDKFLPYGERIAPVGEISGGLWLNNWLTLDANVSAAQFKGLYTTPVGDKHFTTDKMFENGSLRYQNGAYMQIDANLRFDLVNAFAKEEANYHSHVLPYVGTGCAIALGKDLTNRAAFVLNAGIQYRYDILPTFGILAEFKNSWVTKQLDNENGCDHKFHWVYGIKAGFYVNILAKDKSQKADKKAVKGEDQLTEKVADKKADQKSDKEAEKVAEQESDKETEKEADQKSADSEAQSAE